MFSLTLKYYAVKLNAFLSKKGLKAYTKIQKISC
ncbi:unnamed protein product [Brugia timori]|uniref:Transposase n=1 Tax=Brugia timori TaxID=42155 RepID=A0A0R3R5M5_9BILA|nr:unnamed protein product [Brugia timori]